MINTNLPAIYLASSSPQRQTLLTQLGVNFIVVTQQVDEQRLGQESAENMVERLAIAKAQDGAKRLGARPYRPILGADTLVVIDNEILGKPANKADALHMLAQLSGQTHHVLSAVAVVNGDQLLSRVNKSSVTFAEISLEQRQAYWETGEPIDKAGAYAVQGQAGMFISRIEGSYSGIMGLPLYETSTLLQSLTIKEP